MPQLRHAQTSTLIAEGTPLELVHIVDELGLNAAVIGPDEQPGKNVDAIYDGVGLGFDPDAVRQAHAENVDGLALAAKAAPNRDERRPLERAHKAALADAQAARERAPDVAAELEAARELVS